jgi:hypothetical protein
MKGQRDRDAKLGKYVTRYLRLTHPASQGQKEVLIPSTLTISKKGRWKTGIEVRNGRRSRQHQKPTSPLHHCVAMHKHSLSLVESLRKAEHPLYHALLIVHLAEAASADERDARVHESFKYPSTITGIAVTSLLID